MMNHEKVIRFVAAFLGCKNDFAKRWCYSRLVVNSFEHKLLEKNAKKVSIFVLCLKPSELLRGYMVTVGTYKEDLKQWLVSRYC